MAKRIIAGLGVVAGLGVALLPVGVFATDVNSQTDTLKVTIDTSCTFVEGDRTDGDGTWDEGTLSKTMTNGETSTGFGSTKFTISCNDNGGYHLDAVGTPLNGKDNGENIPLGIASTGDSGWTIAVAGTHAVAAFASATAAPASSAAAADKVIATYTGAVSEDEITVTYGVAISDTQAADEYTGTIAYTLSHPDL